MAPGYPLPRGKTQPWAGCICWTSFRRIECYASATIVALDHALRIVRVDPQVMVVAVGYGYIEKGTPAINRLPGLDVQHPQRFRVPRVGIDVLVVPCSLPQVPLLAQPLPRL